MLLDRPLFKNLKEKKVDGKIRFQAIKYVLLEEELYYWTIDGVLLKCIDKEEAKVLMSVLSDRPLFKNLKEKKELSIL